MANAYKKTVIQRFPKTGKTITRDGAYWKHLELLVTKKERCAVTRVEFSPIEPYNYAATSSTRVQIHSGRDEQVIKTFSCFRELAYCGSYRADGKLLVAGGDEGVVRLFDVDRKTLLRTLRGHQGATRVSHFLSDNVRVMSASDDKTVRIWDIASQAELVQFADSNDYVRCGATSKASKDIVVTGSYDHSVRMYDARSGPGSVLTVSHGRPVESVLICPAGGVVISAGGNEIKVWDVLSGGRLLTSCCNHHKTVTCLAFCSQYQRFLSGSIDRHVKIYDVSSYQAVHSLDYPSAVLSLDVSPDDRLIAVGMSDGLLSVQRRRDEEDIEKEKFQRYKEKKASYRYRLRAITYKPTEEDEIVRHQHKDRLEKYDTYLKKFEHSKALDAAMDIRVRTRTPEVTISVIQELIRRNRIKPALAGRDDKSLVALLTFLQKNISNRKLMNTVLDVSNVILDLYHDDFGHSTIVEEAILKLQMAVETEMHYIENCMEIMGMIETLFSSADVTAPTVQRGSLHQGSLTNTEGDIVPAASNGDK